MTAYLPNVHRLLLAASAVVALFLVGVTIASASAARAADPTGLPPSPGVAVNLSVVSDAVLTVGPGQHVRLAAEVAGGPHASALAMAGRLVVIRMSDGARIFAGRLAEAGSIELGRVTHRERFHFTVTGIAAGQVVFRANWAARSSH